MVTLTYDIKKTIDDFIKNNKPTNLPLIDLKVKKSIKNKFNKFIKTNDDLMIFGSEGFSYSNGFYRSNNKLYVVTFDYSDIIKYALYVEGYEDC
jgi:hypothetical protein